MVVYRKRYHKRWAVRQKTTFNQVLSCSGTSSWTGLDEPNCRERELREMFAEKWTE